MAGSGSGRALVQRQEYWGVATGSASATVFIDSCRGTRQRTKGAQNG
jgi:hypothetical protein